MEESAAAQPVPVSAGPLVPTSWILPSPRPCPGA